MSVRPAPPGKRERKLLLGCARLEDEGSATATLLREGLDWESLCLHALLHSVGPLVHLRLRDVPERELIPAWARQRLLGLAHRAGYQNRHFAAEHRQLAEALGREGIELMVPKGLALVELIYEGNERRPLIDLVYIVPPRDLDAARAVLAELGYAVRREHPAHAAWRWISPTTTMTVEREVSIKVMVLTALVNRPRVHAFNLEQAWPRAERVRIAGADSLMPSPEDLVIYLCAQADVHGYLNRAAAGTLDPALLVFSEWANNRLIRFVDIRETVRHHHEAIDWEVLAARADRAGLGETVRVSLELTEGLLGSTVPQGALDALDGGGRHRSRAWLLDAVRSHEAGGGGGRVKRSVGSWWVGLGPRRQGRAAPFLDLAGFALCDLGSLRRRHPRWPRSALALAYPFRAAWVLARAAAGLAGRLGAGAVRPGPEREPRPVGHTGAVAR